MMSSDDLPTPSEDDYRFILPESVVIQHRIKDINLKLLSFCEQVTEKLDVSSQDDRLWALDAIQILGGIEIYPVMVEE